MLETCISLIAVLPACGAVSVASRRTDGATASALASRAKAEAIPIMPGTTAMGLAKRSTYPKHYFGAVFGVIFPSGWRLKGVSLAIFRLRSGHVLRIGCAEIHLRATEMTAFKHLFHGPLPPEPGINRLAVARFQKRCSLVPV
jgi:hypothetical protein